MQQEDKGLLKFNKTRHMKTDDGRSKRRQLSMFKNFQAFKFDLKMKKA